jgi:hypothetical protein
MKLLVRGLTILIGIPLLVLAVASVVARFSDGPIAMLPGGPLEAGELVVPPIGDWSFASGVEEIELQLLDPARSRTVWIVVHDGVAFVPCGFLDVPLFKQWPYQALEDGRAILRIEGRRFPVELAKVEDADTHLHVARLAADKYGYGAGEAPDPDVVWYFRVASR